MYNLKIIREMTLLKYKSLVIDPTGIKSWLRHCMCGLQLLDKDQVDSMMSSVYMYVAKVLMKTKQDQC